MQTSKNSKEMVANKRVVSRVGQLSLPEPTGSEFSSVFGLNRSDLQLM